MALLRWLRVRQSLSTPSERWMALLAASSASTEFPRRSTVGHMCTSDTILQFCCSKRTWLYLTHTSSSCSCVLPADWQSCEVPPLIRLSAACAPAGCRHTARPCQSQSKARVSTARLLIQLVANSICAGVSLEIPHDVRCHLATVSPMQGSGLSWILFDELSARQWLTERAEYLVFVNTSLDGSAGFPW